MMLQDEFNVKEEWKDVDMDIGPTVLQQMDYSYGSFREEEDREIDAQLARHVPIIKSECVIFSEDENADEIERIGHRITDDKMESATTSIHAQCLESIWCVTLPKLNIFQCDVCHVVYTDKSKLEQHTVSKHTSVENPCNLCEESFKNLSVLSKHLEQQHKLYTCELCGKTLKKRCNYLRHIRIVHFEKSDKYHCVSCNKIYRGKQALKDHIRYSHSSVVHKCAECDRLFKTNVSLQRHVSIEHRSERHECEYCFKVYKARHSLTAHLTNVHSGTKHDCEVCNRSFTTKSGLKLHLKVFHAEQSDVKKYQCNMCFKVFRWPNHLKSHIKKNECLKAVTQNAIAGRSGVVGDGDSLESRSRKLNNKNDIDYRVRALRKPLKNKPINLVSSIHKGCDNADNVLKNKSELQNGRQPQRYTCDYCQAKVKCKSTLNRHIQTKHATGSYKCEQCGKTFRCDNYLSNHVAHVHVSEQHECNTCGKVFKSKSLLWTHVNGSHSTREIQCTMCPRIFRLRASLRYHMVSAHAKERHKCDVCKRVFKVKSLLRSHIQRNHSNKTYVCDNCLRVFKMRSTLRIHLQNKICFKGKKESKKAVVVKEEADDGELELGPVVFQHMDCNYRLYMEEPLSD